MGLTDWRCSKACCARPERNCWPIGVLRGNNIGRVFLKFLILRHGPIAGPYLLALMTAVVILLCLLASLGALAARRMPPVGASGSALFQMTRRFGRRQRVADTRRASLARPVSKKKGRSEDQPFHVQYQCCYQLPEPGPYMTSTRRFCGSRTPSAVSTRGRDSPKASLEIAPPLMPRDSR